MSQSYWREGETHVYVGVEVDHHRGLLAEVEETFQRGFLREEVVKRDGSARDEQRRGTQRVGEPDMDGVEEDLQLHLEEGLETLEEVEDDAQREREHAGVVRLAVLNEELAEGALQELHQTAEAAQDVSVHLDERVDGGQSVDERVARGTT